ncbi:hypothetical protein N7492_009733 [Penicillium capsulatum]|uniref:Uncharacterized protein n=1 Tax=Penicillium capsulatum TaxID=69766 RepID=A0A9W9LFD2_9EURO|nr:hypothetical protein N7492_009733 [Penicillium capsulatum]KAJ6114184.1 hypothetical protein N7512_007629 [Penicillium capsulatum]
MSPEKPSSPVSAVGSSSSEQAMSEGSRHSSSEEGPVINIAKGRRLSGDERILDEVYHESMAKCIWANLGLHGPAIEMLIQKGASKDIILERLRIETWTLLYRELKLADLNCSEGTVPPSGNKLVEPGYEDEFCKRLDSFYSRMMSEEINKILGKISKRIKKEAKREAKKEVQHTLREMEERVLEQNKQFDKVEEKLRNHVDQEMRIFTQALQQMSMFTAPTQTELPPGLDFGHMDLDAYMPHVYGPSSTPQTGPMLFENNGIGPELMCMLGEGMTNDAEAQVQD